MKRFDEKSLMFASALQDLYRKEEDRECSSLKLELKEDELTEDFTAMIYGIFFLFRSLTGLEEDVVGFLGLCIKLIVQQLLQENEKVEE